jgi:hypothetical protein
MTKRPRTATPSTESESDPEPTKSASDGSVVDDGTEGVKVRRARRAGPNDKDLVICTCRSGVPHKVSRRVRQYHRKRDNEDVEVERV